MKTKLLLLLIPTLFVASCNKTPSEPLLKRHEYYNTHGKLTKADEYEYYGDGRIKKETSFRYNNTEESLYKSTTAEYTYKDKEIDTFTTNFNEHGEIYSYVKEENKFNDRNQPIYYKEQISYDGVTWGEPTEVSYLYEYDANDNLTKYEMTHVSYGMTLGYEYTYDNENREVLEKTYQVVNEVKEYNTKIDTEYDEEENYHTKTVTCFYIEDDIEEFSYRDVSYYDENDFCFRFESYEDEGLESIDYYSYDGNVMVETSMRLTSSRDSLYTSSVKTTIYNRNCLDNDALVVKAISTYPNSSTGDPTVNVRNYKYDSWGHIIELSHQEYRPVDHVLQLYTGYTDVYIY